MGRMAKEEISGKAGSTGEGEAGKQCHQKGPEVLAHGQLVLRQEG